MNATGKDVRPRVRDALNQLQYRHERISRARQAVLEVLDATTEHLNADQIVAQITARAPGVHRATVYRTLSTLSELKLITHTHVGGSAAVYHLAGGELQPSGLVGENHAHVQCTTCSRVFDIPVDAFDRLADRLRDELHFSLAPHHTALLGTCADCLGSLG